MTTAAKKATAPQTPLERVDWAGLDTPIGRAQKVAPGRSGGVAYANAEQLASLSGYIARMTAAANETGWHAPNMIVSLGEIEEESIVVGVRWVNGEYLAEIR